MTTRKILPVGSPDRPLHILVCNDDGITAHGIKNLVEAVRPYGQVSVVAPDSPQSGMGHAISIGRPLRLTREDIFTDIEAWSCSGTPADCVKLAIGVLGLRPDLLVSGINHGSNSSISIFYSGTMSAAMEGAIEGIPSIGFSLCNFRMDADFTAARTVASAIVGQAIAQGIPSHTVLNVNIPYLPLNQLKGMRITRQSDGRFIEEFDRRVDPYGRDYYWLTGKFHTDDHGEDTDEWALAHGYVSICPAQVDITAHYAMGDLNHWDLGLR
ncbi:MAG: 5'/3'-nucleotidase SurE [Bacteroidia bacterium]|nr:5'/3'-nucleotidase SurE [Bacteroidia bacterium]